MIVEGIDTVYTPKGGVFESTWHGLQTPVEGGLAMDGSNIGQLFCPIVSCGIKGDFESPISDVPAELVEFMGSNPLKDWKLILADCRQGKSGQVIPLHVPKAGYQIHQNRALFDSMVKACETVLGQGAFEIATAGTLGAYSQFFLSIAIKGQSDFNIGQLANGTADVWKTFFNLNSSHNGLIGSNIMLSNIRVVCMNTVQMSIADAENQGTIRGVKHTKNSLASISAESFAADLAKWISQKAQLQSNLAMIRGQKMTVDGFRSFAAGVFTNEASDDLSTTSYNRVQEMVPAFQRGAGNTGETVYDAVNAFTEYFTSGNGVGNPRNVSVGKRIATANFGRGNDWKLQAMATAFNPDIMALTMARGTRLFEEKEKMIALAN